MRLKVYFTAYSCDIALLLSMLHFQWISQSFSFLYGIRAIFDTKTISFTDFLLSLLGFLFTQVTCLFRFSIFSSESIGPINSFLAKPFRLSFLKQDSERVLSLSPSASFFFFGSKAHSLPVKPFGCLFSRMGICCCRALSFSLLAVPLPRASLLLTQPFGRFVFLPPVVYTSPLVNLNFFSFRS